MRKITFLLTLISFLAWSWQGNAQLSENFDGANFPPTDWTLTTGAGDFDQSSETADHTTGAANFARYDCYSISGTTPAYLTTPRLVVSATDKTFSFWVNYYLIDGAFGNTASLFVEASSDGGSTWISDGVNYISGKAGTGWFQTTFDLTAFAGTDFTGNNTFVRFKAISDWGSYNIAVDDVAGPAIFVPACPAPTNLTTTNITETTADFDWTENGTATNWTVEYKKGADFTPGTGAQDQIANVAVHPYGFAGFTPNTTYYWYVRADCGGGSTSTWAGPYTFTTLPSPHPFPLTEDFESGFNYFDNVAANDVDFMDETTLFHGGAHSVHNAYTSSNTNILVETGMLDLSGTTAAQLDFWHIAKTEGGYDKCFVEISTDGGATYTALPSTTYQGTATDYAAKGYFHEDSYATWGTGAQTPDNTWWKKETFLLASYNVANVRFRFRLTSDSGINRDGWYIDDIHVFEPSCTAPTNLTVTNKVADAADLGWTDNNTTPPNNGWEYEIVDVTAGGTVTSSGTTTTTNPVHVTGLIVDNDYKFLVRALCDAGNTSDWSTEYAWTQTEVPGCASNPTPVDGATNVPQGTITFSWDAPTSGGTATSYDLYAGATNALEYGLIGNYTNPTADLNINGFNTTLYWQIVPKNAGGDAVAGCPIWSFTTTGPQTDSCAGYTNEPLVAIPDNDPTGVTDTITVTGTAPNVLDDLQVIVYADHTFLGDLEVTLTSPTGTSVVLFANSCGANDTMDIIFDDAGATLACGTPTSGTYKPASPLSAFYAETFDGDWTIKIVDSAGGDTGTLNKWCLVPTLISCPKPINLITTNETKIGADLAWQETGGATVWDVEIVPSGTNPTGTPTNDNVSNPFTWTGGALDTTYDFYVRADCSGDNSDVSVWSGSYTFTTLPSCPDPGDTEAINITTNGADIQWADLNNSNWDIYIAVAGGTAPNAATTPTVDDQVSHPYTWSAGNPSTNYEVWVRADCGGDNTSDLSAWVGPALFATKPLNDDCTNANLLTVGQAFADNAIVTTNVGSTASGETPTPSCSNFGGGQDVWYAVIVPTSGHVIVETDVDGTSSLSDTAMTLYSGDCGSLVEENCNDDGGNGLFSKIEYFGVPDSIIYVRVFEYGNNTFDTFQISAYDTYCTGGTATWSNGAWVGGILPDSTKKVVIDDALDTSVDGTFNACSLEITQNGILNIDTGDNVEVGNGILNNGGIIVTTSGSLTQLSDNAINAGDPLGYEVDVKTTTLQDTDRFTYLGSPSATESTNNVFSWASQVWDFNQATQFWNYLGTGTSANTVMQPAKGYAVRAGAGAVGGSVTMNYSGVFNNGVFTQPLVLDVGTHEPTVPDGDDDATLVANPYPSGLDLTSAGGLINNNTVNNVLIWTHDSALDTSQTTGFAGDDYIVCSTGGCTNAPTGGSHNGTVAPGQGFFVNATAAGTLTINNSMRTGTYNNLVRNPSNDEKIWINTGNSLGYNSNILLEFTNNGTLGFDEKIDAKKPLSTTFGLSFYAVSNDQKLAIEDKGIFDDDITIPVGLIVNDPNIHDLTFNIANAENFDDINVYLIDHVLNVTHDLKQANYTINDLSEGEYDTRFEILFSRSALNVEDTNISNNSLIVSNDNANQFKVSIKGATIKNFKAFDALGKLVIDMQPDSNSFFVPNNLKEGTVLFIKATLQNGTVLTKKFVKL